MIQAWLDDKAILQKNIEIEIFSVKIPRKNEVFYLNAKIQNDLKYSLCVPSNLFHSRDLQGITTILKVYDKNDNIASFKSSTPPIKWPTNRYVIVLPSAIAEISVVLSDFYSFGENAPPRAASFMFPAFNCDVLERGYPISNWISADNPSLAKVGPLTVVDKDEVVVFRGAYPAKQMSD
jgi:hypothetical protein